jgi:hypothetical protein
VKFIFGWLTLVCMYIPRFLNMFTCLYDNSDVVVEYLLALPVYFKHVCVNEFAETNNCIEIKLWQVYFSGAFVTFRGHFMKVKYAHTFAREKDKINNRNDTLQVEKSYIFVFSFLVGAGCTRPCSACYPSVLKSKQNLSGNVSATQIQRNFYDATAFCQSPKCRKP